VSRTLDDRTWIAALTRTRTRASTTCGMRQEEVDLPVHVAPDLENSAVKMWPVVIESHDHSSGQLPVAAAIADPDGDARPPAGAMVLLVHGGPWGRDGWGYNTLHQLLANRGYAVLSVNYRGSVGFGKKFVNAGNLEWGKAMHQDLIDAVQWAIIRNRPKTRLASWASYGGYATLAGLTMTPESSRVASTWSPVEPESPCSVGAPVLGATAHPVQEVGRRPETAEARQS